MELKGFRELLLKKLEITENSYLQDFVRYAKDDLIAERVLESLEKMAQPSAAMGRGANSALTAYGGQLTKTDIEQLKDALAHHISHYRGALKAGNRDAADKHLNKIIPLMHTIGRVSKHSGGKLALDYRSTTPWESNYTTLERHPHNNKLKEGTKDLGRRPKKTREGSSRGVPDYRYLEMPPHAGHAAGPRRVPADAPQLRRLHRLHRRGLHPRAHRGHRGHGDPRRHHQGGHGMAGHQRLREDDPGGGQIGRAHV